MDIESAMARFRPSKNTILLDTFIKLLDDEVNNLEDEQVIDIHNDKIDEKILESEDNILKTYTNRA